jgi:SAM-dependent methyltransferase
MSNSPTTPSANPNQALWEKGDFTRLAANMRASGNALVEKIGVKSGMRVLDVGCGDGTTAVPEAQRGAEVLGVDIARNLVDAGNRRAQQLGLTKLKFQQGDACDLQGVPDQSFDLVVSIFGAMFAPRPLDVAKSMVRVTKPGGRIVMGNWIPGDPTLVAQVLKTCSAYTPPPPEGFISPMLWGVESHVVERFGAAGIKPGAIRCEKDTYTFTYPGSPAAFLAEFRDYYGPTMNAFAAAEKNGKRDALQADLDALFASQNQSKDPAQTIIPATFLRVTVQV